MCSQKRDEYYKPNWRIFVDGAVAGAPYSRSEKLVKAGAVTAAALNIYDRDGLGLTVTGNSMIDKTGMSNLLAIGMGVDGADKYFRANNCLAATGPEMEDLRTAPLRTQAQAYRAALKSGQTHPVPAFFNRLPIQGVGGKWENGIDPKTQDGHFILDTGEVIPFRDGLPDLDKLITINRTIYCAKFFYDTIKVMPRYSVVDIEADPRASREENIRIATRALEQRIGRGEGSLDIEKDKEDIYISPGGTKAMVLPLNVIDILTSFEKYYKK